MRNFFKNTFFIFAIAAVLCGFFSCESTQIESESLNSETETLSEIENEIESEQEIQSEETASENKTENTEWKFLEPENSKPIASGQTKITFKTNKPKAAVYVNKNFQGLTPLEINSLIPGDYFVAIKGRGYKTVQIAIQIKDGMSDFYYIELEVEDSEQILESEELVK